MILSWIGALLVGVSLGLFGSGGSILTVPVLIYLAGEQEKVLASLNLTMMARQEVWWVKQWEVKFLIVLISKIKYW